MHISELSVKYWQLTLLLFLMTFVTGIVTLFTIPREEDPELTSPIFPIVIMYSGSTTSDMEKLVVKPIEEKFSELDDIDQITSEINEGVALVKIRYNFDVNYNEKYQEVVREIDALRNELPSDVDKIEVKKVTPSDVNVIQLSLLADNLPFSQMHEYAENLKTELEKISSLKNVNYSGCPEQIIKISLDDNKINQYHISPLQIIDIIRNENKNIPSGDIDFANKNFNIKTNSHYEDLMDFGKTVLLSLDNRNICLNDVADVKLCDDENKHICRFNGKRAIFITASLKPDKNITKESSKYEKVIQEFKNKLPDGIELVQNFNQAESVSHRLTHLGRDFLIAILLVLITLLPIGLRSSYIVMLAIPLSLSVGLTVLNLLGFTLNQLSIVGLVVTLGLLVDDSIIVVENIERWIRKGYSKKQAAIKAVKQIDWAVVGCTMILIFSFIPLAMMPGESGAFIRSIPVSIIVTICASLLVSLTIVPFFSTIILKDGISPEGNRFLEILNKIIHLTYSRVLNVALKHPKRTVVIACTIFAISIMIGFSLGFTLFPTSEKPQFLINIETERGSSLDFTDKVAHDVETTLERYDSIKYYLTNVGKGNPQVYYNELQHNEAANYSQIFVMLKDDTSPQGKQSIINRLQKEFSDYPGAKIEVRDFQQGPPIEAPIAIRVFGENQDTLNVLSKKVEDVLNSIDGTIYVNNPLRIQKTDFKIQIDKQKAALMGITPALFEKTIRLYLEGTVVGKFVNEDNDYNIKVFIDEKDKNIKFEQLKNMSIINKFGNSIPISAFTKIELSNSAPQIKHLNKNRYNTITAYVKEGYLASDINKKAAELLSNYKLPTNCHYELAGEAENISRSFDGFTLIIVVAIFGFICVLILEFKTFKSLIIVLSVIPLGVIGGILMLLLAGQPLSFVAIIGFIALVGIEVRNSILLVDFTNQLRATGVSLDDAIIKAGEIRFVPIILTAMTTILGLLPLIWEFSPLYSPLALVIVGGILTSTLLSRIVTPVMYKLLPPKIEVNK